MSPVLEGGREGGLGLVLSPLFTDRPGVWVPFCGTFPRTCLVPFCGTSEAPLSLCRWIGVRVGWCWFGFGFGCGFGFVCCPFWSILGFVVSSFLFILGHGCFFVICFLFFEMT